MATTITKVKTRITQRIGSNTAIEIQPVTSADNIEESAARVVMTAAEREKLAELSEGSGSLGLTASLGMSSGGGVSNITIASGKTAAAATSGSVTFNDELPGEPVVFLSAMMGGAVATCTASRSTGFDWVADASCVVMWLAVYDDNN